MATDAAAISAELSAGLSAGLSTPATEATNGESQSGGLVQSVDRALSILVDAKEHAELPDFPPGWHHRAPRGYVALALRRLGLG